MKDAELIADNIGMFIADSYVIGYMNSNITGTPSKITVRYGY